ncbi:hypothetical protein R84981_002444 [Carnimonas sp. R-84981]|uniref:DUF4232 domain-containing protein n=1 Tax=Carnimonas bestiolae TaxID=3402172 RepID=UPI003EDBDADA
MNKITIPLGVVLACALGVVGCSKAEHDGNHENAQPSAQQLSACSPGQLEVAEAGGDAGAGSVYLSYTFTNTGDAACTLNGTPGVQRISADHGEIPPTVAPKAGEHSITLKPHDHAYLSIGLTNMGRDGSPYDTDECKPVTLQGFAITLHEGAQPIKVAHQGYGCSTGIDKLEVQPFSATDPGAS